MTYTATLTRTGGFSVDEGSRDPFLLTFSGQSIVGQTVIWTVRYVIDGTATRADFEWDNGYFGDQHNFSDYSGGYIERSFEVPFRAMFDQIDEPNETLSLVVSISRGAQFANGKMTKKFKVTIVESPDVNGGRRDDVMIGTEGRDRLNGNDGNDTLRGLGETDILTGGNGDDLLVGGEGLDSLYGGSGNDRLFGGPGVDYIDAWTGDDLLVGGPGGDYLNGYSGFDTLSYRDAKQGVTFDLQDKTKNTGDAEGDRFGSDIEAFEGSDHDDRLYGTDAADIFDGRGGDDLIHGRRGDDTLMGGAGDDILMGGVGRHVMNGGKGWDEVHYTDAPTRLLIRLGNTDNSTYEAWGDRYVSIERIVATLFNDEIRGNARANDISGAAGDDFINGAGGNDTLTGDGGNDRLIGDKGADRLSGGDGNDTLIGGIGGDRLDGGAGDDTLTGGASKDAFVFAPGGGTDTVTDFSAGDVLDLTAFGLARFKAIDTTGTPEGLRVDLDGAVIVLAGVAELTADMVLL